MRWTYKLLRIAAATDASLQHELDNAGADGWELATMFEQAGGFVLVLKRSVSELAHQAA